MELSISAIAQEYKEEGVNRNMIVQALIDAGYLEDIKTPTEAGRHAGISVRYNRQGNPWLVYDERIQARIQKSIPGIKEKYAYLGSKRKEKTQKSSAEEKAENIVSWGRNDTYPRFPYLCIDAGTLVNDTETTGVTKADEVVEFSLVNMDKEVLYHSYFYPEQEVNPFAAETNGLNKAKLKGQPRFIDEWEKIKKIAEGHVLMGHNLVFDKRIVAQTLAKQGHPNAEAEVEALYAGMVDTLPLAKKLIDTTSYSLNNLTTLLGITREEQHDATDDCILNIEFVERLEDVICIRQEYGFVRV